MSDEVRVSVVVAVYNPGPLIERLVDSLLWQTMPAGAYEVIFVDDGSTDGSGRRVDELASTHPHMHAFHIPNSGWPGRPRNIGIDAARGRYVYFVDHDDWLSPEALERLADRADRGLPGRERDRLTRRMVEIGEPPPRFIDAPPVAPYEHVVVPDEAYA